MTVGKGRYSLVYLNIRRWAVAARVRIPLPGWRSLVALKVEFSAKESYDRPRPYALVELALYRFELGVRLGGFWKGEESEDVSLGGAWASFDVGGLPNLVCVARGHRPRSFAGRGGYTWCDRCDEILSRSEPDEPPRPPGAREDVREAA